MADKHKGKRMVKSVFEGPDYIKGWKEWIRSIEDKIATLRAQSNAADLRPPSNTPKKERDSSSLN
ncbi:hypothetical protein Trisim1_006444 [Trichoderma cf. simile WF8]